MEGKRPMRTRNPPKPDSAVKGQPPTQPGQKIKKPELKPSVEKAAKILEAKKEMVSLRKRQDKLDLKLSSKSSKEEKKLPVLHSKSHLQEKKPSTPQKPRANKTLDINSEKKRRQEEEEEKEEQKREEKKGLIQAPEKFENCEPHPLYVKGRYIILKETNSIHEILKVSSEGDFVHIKDHDQVPINQQNIAYLGKVFATKRCNLESVPDEITKLFKKDALNNDSMIIIAQKLTPSQDSWSFCALIPNSNRSIAIDIQLKDSLNLSKELKDFEQDVLPPSKTFQNSDLFKELNNLAQNLNSAYQNYYEQVKAIEITRENMEDLLYSIVNFEDASSDKHKIKQGLFLRIKFDPYSKDFILFFRLLNTKNNQKERVVWLELSKYKFRADLSRGFVSLDYFATLENVNNSQQKLKPKSFTMISYRESMRERLQLRRISHLQDHDEEPRHAPILKDSTHDRCHHCNYIASEIEHLKCGSCSKVYHEQCLKRRADACLGLRETEWRCQDCIRCVNCLSSKNRQSLLVCQKCNSASHFDCLDHSVKLAVPNLSTQDNKESKRNLIEQNYKCERCVQCENCGAREAGEKRKNRWSKDFKLCSNCNKKRNNKQYCLICERFWPENFDQNQEISVNSQPQQMILCVHCGMWIHLECDRMFQSEEIRKNFEEKRVHYNCPDCRQQTRVQLISQLIERLSNEDKLMFFQEPVEDQVQNYTKVVKTPMCFRYIRQKLQSYLKNPEQLKSDVALIFSNAMLFNLPKHRVHKEAIKINEQCMQIMQSVWGSLEKNKNKTIDEEAHKERVKIIIRGAKGQLESDTQISKELQEQSQDQTFYQLRAEDLFDMSEHASQLVQTSAKEEQEMEGIEFQEETKREGFQFGDIIHGKHFNEEEEDSDDPEVMPGGDSAMREHSQMGIGAISKNLRARKNINYNEDRLLGTGSGLGPSSVDGLSLSGQKRAFKTSVSFAGHEDPESLREQRKRQKQIQSNDFVFNQTRHHISGTNLLQQAIQQEAKLQEQQELEKERQQAPEVSQIQHIQQQQQMMMTYYQEIDDEKCYYSNPARCSFDDPALMFEEMCYLCGSFGNREDFLSCTLCGESFHTYCLQMPDDKISKFQPYWKCLNCKFCELCSSATQEAFLLYCDVCDKAFHSFCLKPQLKTIPNCQWKCQECFSCIKCGTKSFFSQEEAEQKRNLEVTDFEFSQNFQYCYSCGLNEYKKSFCKICQKKSEDEMSSEENQSSGRRKNMLKIKSTNKNARDKMMKCKQCGFYSHLRCSRLLPDQDNFDQDEMDYKCLDCLLTGKTINHLIRETCEHYENIHQIISRQKLLAQLCQEILSKYFPIQEKAPLFIKSFIDQNQDFFRHDPIVNEWLSLLETNVCFESTEESQTSPQQQNQNEDEPSQANDLKEDEKMNEASPEEDAKMQEPVVQEVKEVVSEKPPRPAREAQIKKWKDVNLQEAFNKFEKPQGNETITEAEKVYHQMYGHKESFLPQKRNLYQSLSSSNVHRFGQRPMFQDPHQLVGLITVPTEERLSKIDFAEEYVKIELKTVMRVKMQFFRWFEELIRSIIKNNQKFLRKEKRKEGSLNQEQSEDVINTNSNQLEEGNHQLTRQLSLLSNEQDILTNQEDTLLPNPQIKLQCVLCRLNGEYQITGRLIPFQVNQFVHVNCAMWSTDVYEIGDGQLINFFYVHAGKAKHTKCVVCNETGASVFCFTKKCHNVYHFPCAYRNQRMAFLRTKETYCDACARYRDFKIGYPVDLTTRRRFQIAKNQQPYNMIVNQPQGVNPTQNPTLLQLQQSQVNLSSITNTTELEKALQIEKWRPYYYDMFNRVGNLTVLSLKKEINYLIEESVNPSKKDINLEQLQDFAAIRIYWKFYKDCQMNIEDENDNDPCLIKKTFFLYSNNQIRELLKNDLHTIMLYASDKVKDKIQLGIHLNQQRNIYVDSESQQSSLALMNQTSKFSQVLLSLDFWQKIMVHFQKERPNFSLQNIIFSISEFGGKTKYPISIWNRAEAKNKSFFIKSGSQVLQAQNLQGERDQNTIGQPNAKTGQKAEGMTLDDVFKRMMKINQMGEGQNPMSSMKRLTSSKHMKYENMLHLLGKKMFYTKSSHFDDQQHNANKNVLAKKIRLTDTIDTNKEIDLPIAMKYRLSKSQPKRVEVGPSKIHRNGLFTLEDLMPGDIVIEYVGEKIRNKVADKREIFYEQKGIGDCYLFRLDKEYIIDATFYGNKARYLNHSCDANCSAKIINVQQQKHIIISTNRAIKSGEELTYNYNFDIEADKIECFCGAPSCLGRLN